MPLLPTATSYILQKENQATDIRTTHKAYADLLVCVYVIL